MRVSAAFCILSALSPQVSLSTGSASDSKSGRAFMAASGASLQGAQKASAGFWPFDSGFGFEDSADSSQPSMSMVGLSDPSAQAPSMSVPGEGAIQDEEFMANTPISSKTARARKVALLANHAEMAKPYQLKGPAAAGSPQFEAPPPYGYSGDAPQRFRRKPLKNPPKPDPRKQTVAEFDMASDAPPKFNPHHQVTVDPEEETLEERRRKKRGDVEKVQPVHLAARKKKSSKRRRGHPFRGQARFRRHRGHPHLAQKAVVVEDAAHRAAHMQPGHERMMQQCMSFANYMKTQGADGTEFVRMWGGTCDPAIQAGGASPQYVQMCSALKGAVSGFITVRNWPPGEVCQAIVRVMTEAGVGMSPLEA